MAGRMRDDLFLYEHELRTRFRRGEIWCVIYVKMVRRQGMIVPECLKMKKRAQAG